MKITITAPPTPRLPTFDELPNGAVFQDELGPTIWMKACDIFGAWNGANCVRLSSGPGSGQINQPHVDRYCGPARVRPLDATLTCTPQVPVPSKKSPC